MTSACCLGVGVSTLGACCVPAHRCRCKAYAFLPRKLKVWCFESRMKPGIAAGFQDESDEKEAVETFLCTGSEVAFGKLASLLFIRLVRYFSIRGLDAHTAEELAQDVLMIIYRKAEMLRNKESFYGWLYKIARNQHLQHVRRHKHDAELVDLDRLPLSSEPET